MDILEEIVAHKQREVEEFRQYVPFAMLYSLVEPLLEVPQPSLRGALMDSCTPLEPTLALPKGGSFTPITHHPSPITHSPICSGIISEFKRKSPSKGWIHQDARVDRVAKAYEANGASALSILTDSCYFGGCDEHVQSARAVGVKLPILYKNFIIDEYQLYQARHCGASAVLLIAAVLTRGETRTLLETAHDLGLEVLLEMHNERDLEYADLEPDVCGINNRDLGSFVTDVNNSFRLAELLPKDACKVSESGISDPLTVKRLRQAGFRGFLIGGHFMKQKDPGRALHDFIQSLNENK